MTYAASVETVTGNLLMCFWRTRPFAFSHVFLSVCSTSYNLPSLGENAEKEGKVDGWCKHFREIVLQTRGSRKANNI